MRTPEEIFAELAKRDESLLDHKDEIMKAIETLLETKPDTKFDESFAKRLKANLLKGADGAGTGGKSPLGRFSENFRKHVRLYAGLLAALFLVFGGIFAVRYVMTPPSVLAGNWDFQYRKIPYDVPSIDLTLSKDLDASSVNANTVHIAPYVEGGAELKNGNVISYKLSKPMKIGDRYTIMLGADISSAYGVKLGRDITYEFEAVAGAKAVRIMPEHALENPTKNIVVLFNMPIIPLTSNENKDQLPCPITIAPAVSGKCKWTSSTILEYVPDAPFALSTKYHVEVASVQGLLYPLSEKKSADFETATLALLDGTGSFDPHLGVPLRFNTEVKTADLPSAFKIRRDGKDIAVTFKTATGSADVGRNFYALGADGSRIVYDVPYSVVFSGTLQPASGNLAMTWSFERTLRSEAFLTEWTVNRSIYSETGALVDSVYVAGSFDPASEKVLPKKNGFLILTFAKEVSLDEVNLTLKSDHDIKIRKSYAKKEVFEHKQWVETRAEVDDKTRIRVDIDEELRDETAYSLVIPSATDTALEKDITLGFKTLPTLAVRDFVPVSNTEACLYLNNRIANSYSEDPFFELEPKAPIRSLESEDIFSDDEKKAGTFGNGACKRRPNEKGYLVNMRPNPGVTYVLKSTAKFEDFVGNMLVKPFVSKPFVAMPVRETDKYVYSVRRDVNTIPSGNPMVAAYRTTNLDSLYVEACAVNEESFLRAMLDFYNASSDLPCPQDSRVKKTIPVQNHVWNLTNTSVDIEKDIFGRAVTEPFVFIRTSSNGRFNQGLDSYRQEGRETYEAYSRQWLALALEMAGDKAYVFATDVNGTEIPKNLTFQMYVSNVSGVSLADAKATFNAEKGRYEMAKNPNFLALVAKDPSGRFAIVRSSDQTSNYDFGYVSGQSSSMDRDYAFFYTDRPLYKAGDKAEFKGLLRRFEPAGYRASNAKSVKLNIRKEDGSLFKEMSLNVDNNSNFHGSFDIPKDASSGRYSFEIYAGEQYVYNDGYFHVEAYRKPTFKVNLSSASKDHLLGDSTEINVSGEYYFGGKLYNTDYSYSVLLSKYFFDAKAYSDYQFGETSDIMDCLYWGACGYGDMTVETGSGRIGETGDAKFSFKYPTEEKNPNANNESNAEKLYTFSVDVRDPMTARTVTNSHTEVLHATDGYIGIKSGYSYAKNSDIPVDGVILDFNANPKKGAKGRLELIKREWKMAKKQGVDGVFYDEYALSETKEKSVDVQTDNEGQFHESLKPASDGEYAIRAVYTGSNGKEYVSVRYAYVESDRALIWNTANNSVTELVAEKGIVKPGETAVFTLKSPVRKGKYFVSIEKDDGLLDSYVRDLDGYSARIEVPIKDAYIPNVYVKVYLIGKDDGAELPVFKRALSGVKVISDSKKLQVEVVPGASRAVPGGRSEVTIRVKDEAGNPVTGANGSLSVVDESLLALLGNPKKNPFAFFYEMRRYLGVETYVSLATLVDRLNIPSAKNGEKGGAGDALKGWDAKKKRGDFRDTAFWTPDFVTDKNGEAHITIEKLPDNLTNWVYEAVVSLTAGNKVGIGTASVMTVKPLMVMENLPRFLASGDSIVLNPSVTNRTGKDGYVSLSINATNLDLKNTSERVFVKNGESKNVAFFASAHANGAKDPAFASKLNFRATIEGSDDSDEVENIVPILDRSMEEITATVGHTDDASYTEKLDLSGIDNGKLSISYAASPFATILEGMNYLRAYPYGCIEQQLSAIMPNLAIKALYESVGEKFDLKAITVPRYVDKEQWYVEVSIDQAIRDFLATISNFQRLDGGFVFWQDQKMVAPRSDLSLSSMVGRSLGELKASGYRADANVEKLLVDYLKARLGAGTREECKGTKAECAYSVREKLEAISALAVLVPDDAASLKFFTIIDGSKLDPSEKFAYMKTLVDLQNREKDVAQKDRLKKDLVNRIEDVLKNDLVVNARGAFVGGYGESTRILNTATLLEAISAVRPDLKDIDPIIDNVERYLLASKKSDGSFGSTQETSAVIRSISEVLRSSGELKNASFIAQVSANENLLEEHAFSGASRFDVAKKVLETKDLPKVSELVFAKNGNGRLYYDLELSHLIAPANIVQRDEGFYVETHFYDLNEYRKIQTLKDQEWKSYLNGDIELSALRYPKEVSEYLSERTEFAVGQLAYVETRIVTPEARRQVAFESMIPSGAELVNTVFATETANAIQNGSVFDHEELRDDRYFGSASNLESGDYRVGYTLRFTHSGTFGFPPARAYEFGNGEVSGNGVGRNVTVK